jgi:hypothetical protein
MRFIMLTIATTSMAELKIQNLIQVDTIGKASLEYVNTGFWTYTKVTVKCKAYDIDDNLIGLNQHTDTGIIFPGFTSHTILDIELGEMKLYRVHCKTWEQ